jgi:CHAT domain-containing protein
MTGDYELRLAIDGPALGHYLITLASLRPERPGDEKRIAAERAFAEGRRLRLEGSKASLDRALERFRLALLLWRELKGLEGEASTLVQIGFIFWSMGDVSRFIEYESHALSIWRSLGDRRGEGEALSNLGLAHSARGENEQALEYLRQALPLRQAAGDTKGTAETLNITAGVYLDLGDFQAALGLEKDALDGLRTIGDRRDEAVSLNDLGGIYSTLGRSEQALEYYSKALALNRQVGNQRREAVNLENMAKEYEELGDALKAQESLTPALALFRKTGNRTGESVALSHLGRLHAMRSEHQQALQYYEQALTMQRSLRAAIYEANTGNLMAETYLQTNRPGEALAVLEKSLALAREVADRPVEATALAKMAWAYRDLGSLDLALARIEDSIRLTESLRNSVQSEEFRTSYLATAAGRYHLLIELLMRSNTQLPGNGFAGHALEVSERARARGLLDLLAEARAQIREGVDPDLLKRERFLRASLEQKTQRQIRILTGEHTAEQAVNLEKEVKALTLQYDEIEAEIRAHSPHYAALTQLQPLKIPEIQQLLDSETLLLEYALGEEKSFLWVASPTYVESFELPKRSEVEAAARKAYDELRVLGPSRSFALDTLSRMVLGPAASRFGTKRLAIVADGPLQYVPFASLRSPSESGMLVENHEVVSLPSVSTLSALRREVSGRKPAPKLVAVFADPVFDRNDPRVGRRKDPAPFPLASEDLERSARETGLLRFERLRATRQEALAIVSLTGAANSFEALDFRASRKAATSKELADYRIVHFATHGLLNSQHPELSGLVLSLVDREGRAQNGFLETAEVYNLKLGADLVVLSACQTALGKDVRGEGLVGLTRGFMYAGAPRVIASLWSVPDQATTQLMRRFYEAVLVKQMTPAAGLRAAQIALRGEPRWSAPYYWAGFVLQGEWN